MEGSFEPNLIDAARFKHTLYQYQRIKYLTFVKFKNYTKLMNFT